MPDLTAMDNPVPAGSVAFQLTVAVAGVEPSEISTPSLVRAYRLVCVVVFPRPITIQYGSKLLLSERPIFWKLESEKRAENSSDAPGWKDAVVFILVPFSVAMPPAYVVVPPAFQVSPFHPAGTVVPLNCSSVKDPFRDTSPLILFTTMVLLPVMPCENSVTRLSDAHVLGGAGAMVNCNGAVDVTGEVLLLLDASFEVTRK